MQKVIRKRSNRMRDTKSEKVFYAANTLFLTLFFLLTLYPILCLISQGISNPIAVYTGRVTFYPIGFSLKGFAINLQNPSVISGFYNSIVITASATLLGVFVSLITGYALSRKELIGNGIISLFLAFTMWFSGGLIPYFLLIKQLGLYNTRLALILPGVINVWNIIVCRTFLSSTIPGEMFEAASIDGCGYFRFFWYMILPLSGTILAVLSLWTIVFNWNAYFDALIFVVDNAKKPLQLYLRELLISVSDANNISEIDFSTEILGIQELVKSSLILLSCLPLWVAYPFVQKFFVKGIMVGSVKG